MTEPRPQPIDRAMPDWHRQERWHAMAFAVVAVAVGWFYAWTCAGNSADWRFGPKQTDYYTLLVDGFRAGQLHLKVDVPPELLALADPYDPALRPPELGLHDASFYRGRYYLYFGVAPAVTLLLPFRVLTGVDLPLPVAVTVFVYGGFLASAAVAWQLRRRFFPNSSVAVSVLALLALATVSMGPVLIRRGNVWELPLSSGYCFAMLAVIGVLRGVGADDPLGRRATGWLAFAAVSLGLAIASRPTYVFAVGLLALPVVATWRDRRQRPGAWWVQAATVAAALGVLGAAVAWHNYARFGDPLEFGVRYQFSSIYESKARHFSLEYLPFNLRQYFGAAAEWSRYFPFVHTPPLPSPPSGYFGAEEVYGLLPNAPIMLLAFCAPFAAWQRDRRDRRALRTFVGALALLAAGPALALGLFYAAMARYHADFAPALALLSVLGVLAIERAARVRLPAGRRVLPLAALGILGTYSVAFAVLLSVVLYGDLRRSRPDSYGRMAALANRPVRWIERLAGTKHGPLEFQVRFTRQPPGTREPLVTLGSAGEADRIFVVHEDGGIVRLGFSRPAGLTRLSRPIAVEEGRALRLRLEMGSLLPPDPSLPPGAAAARIHPRERLVLRLEGAVLIDECHPFVPVSPGSVAVGRDPWARPRQTFSGQISQVLRTGAVPPAEQEIVLHEVVQVLPAAGALRQRQPILGGGRDAAAFVWFVEETAGGRWVVGWADAEGVRWQTAPTPVDARIAHEIEILAVVEATGVPGGGETVVKLDGLVVGSSGRAEYGRWDRDTPVEIGRHRVDGVDCAPEFQGLARAWPRLAAGAADDAFDGMELELRLVPAAPGTREPLVVTGTAGRGDFLFVEHVAEGRVRFGFEHWGKAPVFSSPVDLDFTATQRLEVALGSFPLPRGTTARGRMERLEVTVNGERRWETMARFYPASASEVTVGRNPLGGTACGPVFSGAILGVKRIRRSRRPRWTARHGRRS